MSNNYWHVNSYGYPNPFSSDDRALQAWETLISFFNFSSYERLKDYWSSTSAPRILDSHAVESWKAAFEEFGLLYVVSRSNEIRITPAGQQFRNSAERIERQEFAWIGLSLLLRYPLRGPRRLRGPSDLLLYWFLYAAMRELQNYFWWSELVRVLCRVFQTDEAERAVADISKLRAGQSDLDDFPLPVLSPKGGFYNSLNHVVVHAGMNYLLLGKSTDDGLYAKERRHWILPDWLPMVDMALGGSASAIDCGSQSQFISRMPKAPDFGRDELAYFEYMGAEVPSMPLPSSNPAIYFATIGGSKVAVLKDGVDYTLREGGLIAGGMDTLCKVARGQRVILSHNLNFSYKVEDKIRTGPNEVVIKVRRALPITDRQVMLSILEDMHG
jgi:hypothetical protein